MIDQLHSKFTLCEKRTRLYEQILLVTKNEETMTISPYSVCVCVCVCVCVWLSDAFISMESGISFSTVLVLP